MRGALALILITVISASPVAAEPAGAQDAREIVLRANAAAAKLSAISYTATLRGEGILAQQFPAISGSVVGRKTSGGMMQVRVDGILKSPEGKATPIKYVNMGAEIYFTEEPAKTVKVGRPEETAGLAVNAMCPMKYLGDSVFHEELRSALSLSAPETVEGVECDVVVATYDVQSTKSARFFISKKDNLVRRVENNLALRMAGRPDMLRGSLTFTATNLNTQPAIDDKMFVGEVPAGYKRESFPAEFSANGPPSQSSPAPDWELTSADGKTVSLKSLRGKFVILDFWATWCGPCKMAMPGMQKLHERFKDKPVVVYGMNCWERMPDPMSYVKSKNFTYPQLLKTDQVAAKYGVSGIPAIFVINPEGKIVHQIRGYIADAEDQIAKIIEPALSK
jgi:thiol-disulfide isomerase/thioredoxin